MKIVAQWGLPVVSQFLFTENLIYVIIIINMSKINDRGCVCQKATGEESPGFIGQDAG